MLDVRQIELPELDGAAMEAKYTGLTGQALTPSQQAAWDQIKEIAERFHRADIVLIGVPMWNFGIPYKLKHLVDAISQKDVLFTFDEHGLNGMLHGKKASSWTRAASISERTTRARSMTSRSVTWRPGCA